MCQSVAVGPMESIKRHCSNKPGVVEDQPWGHPVYKVGGKLFVGIGEKSVTVKSTTEKQAVLVLDPAISVADYVGRYGWVTVEVRRGTLAMAKALVDESYESVVAGLPKKIRQTL